MLSSRHILILYVTVYGSKTSLGITLYPVFLNCPIYLVDYGLAEKDPTMLERGPRFILQPTDVTYDPKGPVNFVILECEADANPSSQYEWYVERSLNRTKIHTLEVSPYASDTTAKSN